MNRIIEEESDYFHIYLERENGEIGGNILIVRWFNGKLEIGSEAGLITQEEFFFLEDWYKRTKPKLKYRIAALFSTKPAYVYDEENDMLDFEVEEVWE